MKRDERDDAHRAGHVLVPGAAIGSMSLILAAGLDLLGFLEHADRVIAGFVSRNGAEKFSKELPEAVIWIAAWVFAFGVAWAPVLSLAAHRPDVAAPFIATLWSGLCAMFYTFNHRMPGDESPKKNP